MNAEQVYQLELELLLDGIARCYGYQYQDYARASLGRQVDSFLKVEHCASPSALLPIILHDPTIFWKFVSHVSVPFTNFFRDPKFFFALRNRVIPHLQTFPFLKVWIAGCARGEEVYSLAILLHEEGLLDRTDIYCTDVDASSLSYVQQGMYPIKKIQEASGNYEQAGGKQTLLAYFIQDGTQGLVLPELQRALAVSKHNLTGDGVFGEMNLILCRNVLIYFNQELQNRVLTLIATSLSRKGFLCLGQNEMLQCSSQTYQFDRFAAEHPIFRLRN